MIRGSAVWHSAVGYSSRPGDNVLDPFGGSGSTLIACQQIGRHAYLMDIDPLYCDVIVQRWRDFTGLEPDRIPPDHAATDQEP